MRFTWSFGGNSYINTFKLITFKYVKNVKITALNGLNIKKKGKYHRHPWPSWLSYDRCSGAGASPPDF